jgi:hypothetical protein
MTVYYNGKPIEVTADYNDDGSVKLFRGKDRTYLAAEVIYDGCPQTKYKIYK